ncbi:MAG: protein kinase [Pirellulaceae bacterium]
MRAESQDLEHSAFAQDVAESDSGRQDIGRIIGHYKLLERIGEGGFGVVYMAEQQTPVVRKVALKIIKRGMDSKQVVARFEAERQALALMDHPHIAKILDAGTTDDGLPFFCHGSDSRNAHHQNIATSAD